MKIDEYLINYSEEIPDWLKKYKIGDKVDFFDIIKNRFVYYPGAGFDGQPIKTFNLAKFVHTYLYVDYGVREGEIRKELAKENAFKGYHLLDIQNLNESNIIKNGWQQHYHLKLEEQDRLNEIMNFIKPQPYCLMTIFEKNIDSSDEHGVKRFVLLYLCADGIATYDALFGNKFYHEPDVLVLQDHGFGGNYNCYAKGGILDNIAVTTKTFTRFILCADNTEIWDGYSKINELEPALSQSMHLRYLYKKINML